MRFLLRIISAIWSSVTWLYRQIYRLIKWTINKLPRVREEVSKWTQTFLFYIALGATVFVLCTLPLPIWGKAIGTLGFALLLSLTTVIRMRHGYSEKDIISLKTETTRLEKQLEEKQLQFERLKADMQNQRSRFIDMSWIWEINLAQIRNIYTKKFDYFIRGQEPPIPWSSKPSKMENGDKRAIGVLDIDYTAKIGIDLKQVLVKYDRDSKIMHYWMPEPYQTGAFDLAHNWPIKVTMECSGLLSKDWRLYDEEKKNVALPLWGNETATGYQAVCESKVLQDQLGAAIQGEATRRLKAFFETLLNCEAHAVPREQLQKPDTLGTVLPKLLNEMPPTLSVK